MEKPPSIPFFFSYPCLLLAQPGSPNTPVPFGLDEILLIAGAYNGSKKIYTHHKK